MRAQSLGAALIFVLGIVAEAANLSRLVPEQSAITLISNQMGVPVKGRFARFNAEISVDPAHPESRSRADRHLPGERGTGRQGWG